MFNMIRSMWAGVGILLLTGGCGSAFEARRDFELRTAWNDYRQLIVHNCNGGLELVTHDAAELAATGTVRATGATPAEADANVARLRVVAVPDSTDSLTLRVRLDYPDELRNNVAGASMSIRIPKACRVELNNSNGAIAASGVAGDVCVTTSNGRIDVRDVQGGIQARTSNGAIQLSRIVGSARAESSNGRIELTTVTGDCQVESSNGSIKAVELRGSLTATSSNGAIDVQLTPPPSGRVVLRTSNASILAVVPSDFRARLALKTSNGSVHHRFSADALRITEASRTRLEAVLNGGDGAGRLEAQASNGSITVAGAPPG